jgi:nucleoid-associated protein YgaU
VVEGDTLSDIALWWFGNGEERYWRRIWLANRGVIGEDPNVIFAGQWLRLPLHHVIQYHIVGGDTLWQLAEWVYGDGNAYWVIVNANPWIPDPNNIQPSWWIWIP